MEKSKFDMGDLVTHRQSGPGVVLGVDDRSYEIRFDDGSVRRILLGFVWEYREDDQRLEVFTQEEDGAEHYPGSHWLPFFDEPKDILLRLPEIVPECDVAKGCYTRTHKPVCRAPDTWKIGSQLVWPDENRGLSLVLEISSESNHVVSIFPSTTRGSQHSIVLNKVVVWSSGLEAHIQASWKGIIFTFFDSQFVVNRGHYLAGNPYEFILTGLAYKAFRASKNKRDQPLYMMDNSQCHDVDEYLFVGSVVDLKNISDWLGQPAWKVRTIVMKTECHDFALDIVITHKIWGDCEPPVVGDRLAGQLWLQGCLWMRGHC